MIAKDKLQHMYMGAGACVTIGLIHYLSLPMAMFIGSALFGVFYEAQQWYRKEGTPDVWDAIATAFPSFIVLILVEAYLWIQ